MVQYCTRESVKTALDEFETARSNAQIDDAIASGALAVEGLTHRPDGFAPTLATRYFDYPSRTQRAPSWRIWLNQWKAISIDTLTVEGGARTLSADEYFLEPANSGPPYDRIDINLGGAGAFGAGDTHQRAIAATGLWGWSNERRSIGALTSTLAASPTATAALSWTTARFGVGDVLFIDDEAMIIAERNFVDSTQNLGISITASEADTTVAVSTGSAFATEEILLLGAERMRIIDIIGNNLVVKRAWDGSQVAAHTSSPTTDIYALTGVELSRGELGTTVAAHAADAVVYRWVPPPPLASLNRAYALNTLLQERSGYARVAGTGENAREFTGRGIASLEADVFKIYGRKARHRAIVGS